MTLKNRVLHVEKGAAYVVEKAMPVPRAGFVVVKQHLAPNCIEHRIYQTGFYEFHEDCNHVGHEGVGEIYSVGPGVTDWQPGTRVARGSAPGGPRPRRARDRATRRSPVGDAGGR